MGSKGATTTTSSQAPQQIMDAYNEALGKARTATSTPYTPYTGQLVAGLNPTQSAGISSINAASGKAQPYINQANQWTTQAAQGITPELYQKFYSPYVKDVANATQANLTETQLQQMAGLKGGAIQAGAFGGDRAGIAQAEMARQQDLASGQVMSGIYNQGYTQAMGLAGQQVANLGAMGQQEAGLGAASQAAALQGGQAQMAAGAQQQGTEQAQLQALYDQWQQKQAYPYQQAQFFGNIAEGIGAGSGGTSSTTTPGPSLANTIFGGLGAIASIPGLATGGAAKDETTRRSERALGGAARGHFAFGGIPYLTEDQEARTGWIPDAKHGPSYRAGLGVPKPPAGYEDKPLDDSWGKITPVQADNLKALGIDISQIFNPSSPTSYSNSPSVTTAMASPWARGGLIPRGHFDAGGAAGGGLAPADPTPEEIMAYVRQSAIKNGNNPDVVGKVVRSEGLNADPAEAWQSKLIDKNGNREQSFGPFQLNMKQNGLGTEFQNETGLNPRDKNTWKDSVDWSNKYIAKHNDLSPWMGAKGLDPRSGHPQNLDSSQLVDDSPPPTGVASPNISRVSPAGDIPSKQNGKPAGDNNRTLIEQALGKTLSPQARAGLLSGSFALMASRSPWFGPAVGEAGKAGLNTYYNALAQQADIAKTASDIGVNKAAAGKTGAETTDLSIGNWFKEKAAWESDPENGKFPPYQVWKAAHGQTPAPKAGGAPAPVSAAPDISKVDTAPVIPAPGTTVMGKGGPQVVHDVEGPPQPAAPGNTLAWEKGADAAKAGTLPFLTSQITALTTKLNNPQYTKFDPRRETDQANLDNLIKQRDELKGSPEMAAMNAFYPADQRMKLALKNYADLNKDYSGGTLAEQQAWLAGIAQTIPGLSGWVIPKSLDEVKTKHDELVKDQADIINSISEASHLAEGAPASSIGLNSARVPGPEMSPTARQFAAAKLTALQDYTRDQWNTWDQGSAYAQHQTEFSKKYPIEKYLSNAQAHMPKAAGSPTPPNQGQIDTNLSVLNAKYPNKIGTVTKDGMTYRNKGSGWELVQ